MLFYNPFEQFITIPLIPVFGNFYDLTFTNVSLCLLFLFLTVYYVRYIILDLETMSLYAIPTALESHIFLAYVAIQAIIEKHVHIKYYQQVFFPITFTLGSFLLLLNLSGNLPIFMSLTSQFAVISAFCLPTFFGIFLWFVYERNVTFLRTFYAPGTEIGLAIVLFPVELLTYFMRPISIIARLCANIMSGHVIVKVCLQTIFKLTQIKSTYGFFYSILITILLLQLIPLLILEVCVSLIQVYVFLVIFCMFLSDTFGHHYRY
jgi:F-type H+-transporting ATPase subunit a